MGQPTDESPCPVILSWSESGKFIRVSALMGKTRGAGCPIAVGGTACTAENIDSLKAVSYTHLDVYKRQVWAFPTVLLFVYQK